jgi:hypothetical protein
LSLSGAGAMKPHFLNPLADICFRVRDVDSYHRHHRVEEKGSDRDPLLTRNLSVAKNDSPPLTPATQLTLADLSL